MDELYPPAWTRFPVSGGLLEQTLRAPKRAENLLGLHAFAPDLFQVQKNLQIFQVLLLQVLRIRPGSGGTCPLRYNILTCSPLFSRVFFFFFFVWDHLPEEKPRGLWLAISGDGDDEGEGGGADGSWVRAVEWVVWKEVFLQARAWEWAKQDGRGQWSFLFFFYEDGRNEENVLPSGVNILLREAAPSTVLTFCVFSFFLNTESFYFSSFLGLACFISSFSYSTYATDPLSSLSIKKRDAAFFQPFLPSSVIILPSMFLGMFVAGLFLGGE